jgi:hypothetical protein
MRKASIYLCGVLFTMGAKADLVITNLTAAPETSQVVISQLSTNGATFGTRNRSNIANDWRSIGQTFAWNSDQAMDGIGFYLSSATWTGGDQEYVLVVQSLNASSVPTGVVYQAEVLMTAVKVQAGQWMYFDTDNLALQNGGLYGVTLCPTEVTGAVSNNILQWASGADESAYAGGTGTLFNPSGKGGIPTTTSYGSARDLTFYVQAIPEPATVSLYVVSLGAIVGVRRMMAR